MEKRYKPQNTEGRIYKFWEEKGLTKAPDKGVPYTILMPPPNANGSLHAGHGMYVVDDIMIRYKRLMGYSSLWIPGMDHAGFETQYVYEKHLSKKGKSRMDFDRKTLYQNIYEFVQKHSGLIYTQFKKLGFLADWNRSVFTLDKHVLERVFFTFRQMEKEGYVYRDKYIINYCTHCGTTLAELEIKHKERINSFYYIRYPFADNNKYIVVATVRPEPIFVDTHLAVNPHDSKNKHLIGKEVKNPLTGVLMPIIADEFVDPKFGTGIVKLTPAHDQHDFAVAKKHDLPIIPAIDLSGRIVNSGGKYSGMKVKEARKMIVDDLRSQGLIEKIDNEYVHNVAVCYKCGTDLEPVVLPNWFIRVKKLKERAAAVVRANKVHFYPNRFKKQILQWYEIMHDWPISRQIAWGIRIPVWYEVEKDKNSLFVVWIDKKKNIRKGYVSDFLKKGVEVKEIEQGLQELRAGLGKEAPSYVISMEKPDNGKLYLPETDTLDTWFSSGQWPLLTLKSDEYTVRFPTDMLGTLSDILPFWVSRMIMFSLYIKDTVPFKDVYLWSMVADSRGIKMSKSKGNVINPIDMVEKYGADAFRASLLFGVSAGGKAIFSEDKVRSMRNFANKLWNVARFLNMYKDDVQKKSKIQSDKHIVELKKEVAILKKAYICNMDKYRLSRALDDLYDFAWNRLASYYIEILKQELRNGNIQVYRALMDAFMQVIQMLHPFMPFVTEAIYQEHKGKDKSIINSRI